MNLGAAQEVLKSDGSTNTIPIAGEVTIYTRSFSLNLGSFFGVWALASSATGTPNLKIELEESYARPTTEGSAELTLWNVPEVDGVSYEPIFSAINDKTTAHISTITPVPMTFGRYKITGLTANPADATIKIYNFVQEQA